jgi:hypothetical protein
MLSGVSLKHYQEKEVSTQNENYIKRISLVEWLFASFLRISGYDQFVSLINIEVVDISKVYEI